jgi:hypothetical protein
LEDIQLDPKERAPKVFTGSSHGTCLVMREAREQWRDEDLRRLQASLQKLKSPTRGAADFEVKLHCPEFPQYANLDAVDLLDTAHFSLAAIIDEEGMVEFDYECNFGGSHSSSKRQQRNLWHEMNPKLRRKPACGHVLRGLERMDPQGGIPSPSWRDQRAVERLCWHKFVP